MSSTALARRRTADELTGRQKIAVLLMALGEESSAEITRHLTPEEVEAISLEIAKMDRVDPALVEEVLNEWKHTEQAAISLASGGVEYARRLLEKALGSQRAAQILKRIEAQLHDHVSLTRLRNADPKQLVAILRNEHPQTISLILAFLEPSQVAGVLKEWDPALGADILLRVARMEKVLPDVLRIIEDSVGAEADLNLAGQSSQKGGPGAVAEVLNLVSATLEKDLLDGVARVDAVLSEQIKNLMFVFEDLVNLDERGIARLLRDVDTKELALALKLASEDLKARLLGAMSSRARDSLLEEMEFLGPVRMSAVEAAQANIVKLARALEEAGEIVIGGRDDLVGA